MLKLSNVSHHYGGNEVLHNVSLTLAPGQRIAFMGPSGCGKTTLLRILLGLLEPVCGSVENGFSGTAAVFQEPRLLPWRTAVENVNLVLGDRAQTLGLAKKQLEYMQLADAADKYPRELSGGMQQRVAIARALAVEAELLVLDEPFKGLDESLRAHVIRQIAKTKAAIVLVTHDEKEAQTLGCRVIYL
ncbi:MAG: ABC transporter ATP-binding protein [Oscillospiraceae bacterium]|nr:ABC transporter ATP-binding protein [Oscillospiraceae bacterium]